MNLLTRYLSPLRVFKRLAVLEAENAGASVHRRYEKSCRRTGDDVEREARQKADAEIRDLIAQRVPPRLVICEWGGEVLSLASPHVLVMRERGNPAGQLRPCCRRCKSDATGDGYEAIDRTRKPKPEAAPVAAEEAPHA